MRLFLMRHAIAAPRGTPGFARDADRPLTQEGRAQARDVAAGLKRLKVNVSLIATSPYLRARETTDEVVRVLGGRIPVKEMEALRAEAQPADASQALKQLGAHEAVLLVGHEPHLSAWIAELVAGRSGMRCVMKKAGVACIEVEGVPPPAGTGTLRWLMTPKHLASLGKSRKGATTQPE